MTFSISLGVGPQSASPRVVHIHHGQTTPPPSPPVQRKPVSPSSGLVAGFIGMLLLLCSEGYLLRQQASLSQGLRAVVDIDKYSAKNDGALVHVTGELKGDVPLVDEVFGFSEPGALRLSRSVEVYQWTERATRTTEQDSETGMERQVVHYTYTKTWSPKIINSAIFHEPVGHENPMAMPFDAATQKQDSIKLNGFDVPGAMTESLPLASIRTTPSLDSITNQELRSKAVVSQGGFFIGANLNEPIVGDARVIFRAVPQQTVSVVAQQSGSTFTKYKTKQGGSIFVLSRGQQAAEAQISAGAADEVAGAWFGRIVGIIFGFFCSFIMFSVMSNGLMGLARFLPIIGHILGSIGSFVSFALALVWTYCAVQLVWLFHSAVAAGIVMMSVMGLMSVGLYKLELKKGKPVSCAEQQDEFEGDFSKIRPYCDNPEPPMVEATQIGSKVV